MAAADCWQFNFLVLSIQCYCECYRTPNPSELPAYRAIAGFVRTPSPLQLRNAKFRQKQDGLRRWESGKLDLLHNLFQIGKMICVSSCANKCLQEYTTTT